MTRSDQEGSRGWRFWAFVTFMLALMALFIGLGTWQTIRLGEKEKLIADVVARIGAEPIALPAERDWSATDWTAFDYRPVSVTGHFAETRPALVFAALSEARGAYSGPGYWVLAPFTLADGGVIFVNRGFVPQDKAKAFVASDVVSPTTVTLTGIARRAEEVGAFTPAADRGQGVDWVINPARLAALLGLGGPIAPISVDLPAGQKGELPQGGETIVEFPNNHLGYAATWFGFALLVPFLLTVWIRRQRVRHKP